MDIVVSSWQELGTILTNILPWYSLCHGKIISKEPCSQENQFHCKILFSQKESERKQESADTFIFYNKHFRTFRLETHFDVFELHLVRNLRKKYMPKFFCASPTRTTMIPLQVFMYCNLS